MAEELVAQLVLDLAADPDQDHPHLVAEDALHADQAEERPGVEPELLAGDRGGQVVDRVAQHPGRGHREGGGGEEGEEPQEQRPAVAGERGEKPPEVRQRHPPGR